MNVVHRKPVLIGLKRIESRGGYVEIVQKVAHEQSLVRGDENEPTMTYKLQYQKIAVLMTMKGRTRASIT